MRFEKKLLASSLSAILLVGCQSVATFSYGISRTVERSAYLENGSSNELKNKWLLIVGTSEKKAFEFKLKREGAPWNQYCIAKIDDESFCAFILDPGLYWLDERFAMWSFLPGDVLFIEATPTKAKKIPAAFYKKKFADRYLSKEIISTDNSISAANDFFTSKVAWYEYLGHYSWEATKAFGKACFWIMIAAVIVLLIHESSQAETTTIINEISPNAYGPGIHADEYGRPVRVVPAY